MSCDNCDVTSIARSIKIQGDNTKPIIKTNKECVLLKMYGDGKKFTQPVRFSCGKCEKCDRIPKKQQLYILIRQLLCGDKMTNMRLTTSMFEDINFCPFCGKKLVSESADIKRCGFHILMFKGNPEEEDVLE